MRTIKPSMTINDVVNKYPETMKVFNDYGFDTCCGGAEFISTAAASLGINVPKLIKELNDVTDANK